MKHGGLDILNCTDGHTSIYFNPSNEADVERSKRLIEDMMRRGYTFLVDDGSGNLVAAKRFDATKGEYVIETQPAPEPVAAGAPAKRARGRPRGSKNRVKAASAKATVIGRTAGGFPPPTGRELLRIARKERRL